MKRRQPRSRGLSLLGALAFVMISGLMVSFPAVAQSGGQEIGSRGSFNPTAEDLSLLPEYCRARVMPGRSAMARRWASRMGNAWIHIHHYCIALQHMNDVRFKGSSMSHDERRRKWRRIVAEINYVERRIDPSFALWREMQAHKNEAQAQLNAMSVGR